MIVRGGRLLATVIASVAIVLPLVCTQALGYVLEGANWTGATTAYHVSIPGNNGLWDTSFESAMAQWSSATVFKFTVFKGQYADPCNDPNVNPPINGVAFTATSCGLSWGANVLATTYLYTTRGHFIQTGITFNSKFGWSVYTGAIRSGAFDFQRVAVHELGHALGLDHEDAVPSIMHTNTGSIEHPQTDDIAGVRAIYGAASAIMFTSSPPGSGTVGTAYSHTYVTSGSSAGATVTYGLTAGALPPGLDLSTGGVISGTPTTAGTYAGTVTASDVVDENGTQDFSIAIVRKAPAITSAAAPSGIVGTSYYFALAATGTAPIVYSHATGTLPPGLALSAAGVISGTPTTPGTYTGTIIASNGIAPDATYSFSIVVTAPPPGRSGGGGGFIDWATLGFLGLFAIVNLVTRNLQWSHRPRLRCDQEAILTQRVGVLTMKTKSMLIVAATVLVLAISSGVSIAAQDKYTLRVPDGLAFSDFKGYEDWQLISSAKTDDRMKVILGNPTIIAAFKSGIPGNGKPFPDGSKIAKIQWKPKKSTEATFPVEVPDTLADLFFMEKDSKKFPNTGGWAYAQFDYDPTSATFAPNKAGTPTCGHACHVAVKAKDYVFHPYQKR